MAPATHLLRPVCPRVAQPCRKALPAYSLETKEVALSTTVAAKAHCWTAGFVVLFQPRQQSGVSSLAQQQENAALAVLHPKPKPIRIAEQILHFDLSQ